MITITAYCPRCGTAVEVAPYVDHVERVAPAYLDVSFEAQRVRHACHTKQGHED